MSDYTRNKHVITRLDPKEVKTYNSINEAKRESRKLQQNGNKVSVIKSGA